MGDGSLAKLGQSQELKWMGGGNWKIPLILPTDCRNKKRHETAAASVPLASWGKSLKVWGHQVNLRRRITQEMAELGFGHSPTWVM